MKYARGRWLRAAGLAYLALLLALGVRWVRGATLDGWASEFANPGYRLLLKKEIEGYYVAVFDAGGSQLAICQKDVGGGDENPVVTYVVEDLQGNDLISFDLPERGDELDRETYVPPILWAHPRNGVVYPVDPAHVGPVRVVIAGEKENILDEVLPRPRLDPPPTK